MKKLILVRHGESEWNKLNLFTGWTDVELSDKGREEAKQAGIPVILVGEPDHPEVQGTAAWCPGKCYIVRTEADVDAVCDCLLPDLFPAEEE